MKAKIEVTYKKNDIPDEVSKKEIDDLIIKAIDLIGGKWYAQGMSTLEGIRNIYFDLEIENKMTLNIKI